MSPYELQEYSQKLEHISEEKRMAKQQRRMQDLRQQIDGYKSEPNADRGYRPDFSMDRRPGSNRHPRRSLDLDTSKGGAGAPVKDDRGKNMTRRPITLSRDDYGESKIREDIPGKGNFDISFSDEDGRPYYPWGGQGGGAPIRDRQGNVVTQIYGKLEGRDSESAEIRRARRRQEVLYNELKEGERQHKQSKDEFNRYLKAPQADVADVLLAGRVGKPKRDAITGEIGQQHLGNSDVSKLKMNYQEKPVSEKRQLHEDLVRAADERKQARELEKLKEKQESNAHFNNMDRQWGAFGGGAPKHSQIRKKANLTNALFYPDASPITGPKLMMFNPPTGLGSFEQSPIPSYQKLYVDGDSRQYPPTDSTPRFVKSTLNSSHKNMFDANPESRLARGNSVEPPYATGGIY
ncbi:uncharacterized protein LOC101847645 [Aplysia californica]|uniref:Uncharacterized protein LOC101847645 n=1 Tax=Aplysia californica TaxID=6500 RepID=A0ABM0ZWS3_APLCA|nr:uncharacterized protein LOC101847645 [Aplysia californica]